MFEKTARWTGQFIGWISEVLKWFYHWHSLQHNYHKLKWTSYNNATLNHIPQRVLHFIHSASGKAFLVDDASTKSTSKWICRPNIVLNVIWICEINRETLFSHNFLCIKVSQNTHEGPMLRFGSDKIKLHYSSHTVPFVHCLARKFLILTHLVENASTQIPSINEFSEIYFVCWHTSFPSSECQKRKTQVSIV